MSADVGNCQQNAEPHQSWTVFTFEHLCLNLCCSSCLQEVEVSSRPGPKLLLSVASKCGYRSVYAIGEEQRGGRGGGRDEGGGEGWMLQL